MEHLDRPLKADINSTSTISDETAVAIAMALHHELNDDVHDIESYVITIKRRH